MSKYSVGDKFVIEIEEIYSGQLVKHKGNMHLHRIKGFNSLVFDENGMDKLERYLEDEESRMELQASYEEGRKAGQEEAIKWSQQNETDMYNSGLNDAWEMAKKICLNSTEGGMIENVLRVFGKCSYDVLAEMTPQEALAKIEAYEKEQEEIKVGDVVSHDGLK